MSLSTRTVGAGAGLKEDGEINSFVVSIGTLFASGGRDQEVLVWEPTLVPYDPEEGEGENITKADEEGESSNSNNGGFHDD